MYDSIVIGGGPAGLQAALTLGRMHRSVLLLDSGAYRNGAVEHFHNFLSHDGQSPAALRTAVQEELTAYPSVELRPVEAERVEQTGDTFAVTVAGETLQTRTVLLATGIRDELPDVPGLADVWGTLAVDCPFCHGHETAERRVVVATPGEHGDQVATMLTHIGAEVARIDPADLQRVERSGESLVLRTGGEDLVTDLLFVETTMRQRAPFAEQLGLAMLSSGAVEVDASGRTNVPGAFAAGDMAHTASMDMAMASVLVAAASGLVAAASVVQHLLTTAAPDRRAVTAG